MRRTPCLLLGLVGLTACTSSPIKIELEPASVHQSALLVVHVEGTSLTTARVFATSLADFKGLPPSSVTDGQRIHLYVALYDRSLESLRLKAGELTLTTEDVPHYTWPQAAETLTAQVDVGQPAVVRLTPVDPSPLTVLNILTDCPSTLPGLGTEPLEVPARCPYGLRPRPKVCYGAPRAWMGPPGRIRPGTALLDAQDRTWLYYSEAIPGMEKATHLWRVQLVSPGVPDPATLEDLGLPEAGAVGELGAPGVRRDLRELFISWGFRGGPAVEDTHIYTAVGDGAPFSNLEEVSELHRLSGEIYEPFLLPDHRTLVYRHGSRQGLSFARRPSTTAGDAAFVDIGQVVPDSFPRSPSLSCDGGHILYTSRVPGGSEARLAQIKRLDPIELGPSQPLQGPRIAADQPRVIEGPRCEALYIYSPNTLLVAEPTPCPPDCTVDPSACPACGNGVRQGFEACDGADLGGLDCTAVAPDATGTLACTPDCALDTHGCSPSTFNGDAAGLQAGAPWPMFRGGPAHTAQTPVAGPRSLNFKWDYAGVGGEGAGGIVVAANGRIIFGTDGGRLHAVEPNGTRAFMTELPGQIMSSPALARDGTIYVTTNQGVLHALTPEGAPRWSYSGAGGQIRGSPTVAPDGTIYQAFADGRLHAINPDGSGRWSVLLGAGGFYAAGASPALGLDGTIYAPEISEQPDQLYAVTPAGQIRWHVPVGQSLESSAVVTPSGDILFGGRRLSPEGTAVGSVSWGSWGVTLGPGDRVYSGYAGQLVASTVAGAFGWAAAVPSSGPPPPIVGGNGMLYGVGWDPNTAFIVSPTGVLLSQDPESRGLDTPAIGADGTIYAAHGNGIRAYGR